MKAYLKNYRQSPRKVRLVADSIRGKQVDQALLDLQFMVKRSADPIAKLLNSAIANAVHNDDANKSDLYVKAIEVNQGATLKRFRPRARGSAFPINKRTSNVTITLGVKATEAAK